MNSGSPQAHIYQICYSAQTLAALDPGFIPLDNLSNPRPDWREYWPIRAFLLGNELVAGDRYGFLSPRFLEKTRLTSGAVHAFVRSCPADTDVILFSPFFDQIAAFYNTFEQAIVHHSSAREALRLCAPLIDERLDISRCLMSSIDTVYCNYFIAGARFWKAWLERCEIIFDIAESNRGELGRLLNAGTSHDNGETPTKVFVIERVASMLLAMERSWKVSVYDPIAIPHNARGEELTLITLDALKIAYRTRPSAAYLCAYQTLRESMRQRDKAARAQQA